MAVLRGWYLNVDRRGRIYLEGRVEGHGRIPNGMLIHTTPILSFSKSNEVFIAKTRNTEYELPIGSVNIRKHSKIAVEERENSEGLIYYARLLQILAENMEVIRELDEFTGEAIKKIMKEYPIKVGDEERVAKDLKKIMDEKYKKLEELSREVAIEDGELWLEVGGSTPYLFRIGLAKHEGDEYFIEEVDIHLGMFEDSVLIRGGEGIYDLRYFPRKDAIDIYRWSGSIKKAKIYNSGEEPISVIWRCKKVVIEPQATECLLLE